MWREVGQSLTGVLVGLVVVLVPPELPVRRQLARRSHNSPPKQEHPAQRSLKPVKTGKTILSSQNPCIVFFLLSLCCG